MMTTKDLLNLSGDEFLKMNKSEMRKAVSVLAMTSNKRIRSFTNKGESSPAIRNAQKTGGNFSTKGKDLNALRSEFVRAKQFLQSKTSTKSGWNTVKTETIKSLKKSGVEVSKRDFDKMWRAYERLKEISPEVENRGLKYNVLKEIADLVGNKFDADTIINTLNNDLSEIYEQQIEIGNAIDVSDFFEF